MTSKLPLAGVVVRHKSSEVQKRPCYSLRVMTGVENQAIDWNFGNCTAEVSFTQETLLIKLRKPQGGIVWQVQRGQLHNAT